MNSIEQPCNPDWMDLVQRNRMLAYKAANRIAGQAERAGEVEMDDMIQEALIALMRAAKMFDPARGIRFSTFGFTFAMNAVRDAVRRQRNRRRLIGVVISLDEQLLKQYSPSQCQKTDHEHNHTSCATILSHLEDDHAHLLQLHYLQGWSVRQIADHLNVSRFIVRRKLAQARSSARQVAMRSS